MSKQLEEGGFGKWTGHVGEKVLRVLHILAALTAAMTYDQQRLLWYSDTCEWRSESDTRWRRQSETLNDLFFRTGFSTTGGGADGQLFGCVGRSPKGECRRTRCCSLQTGVTQRAGCGRRRFTNRRTNRSDTGPNCQVHSGVEPYTRTTGHECAPSIACLVSPVDIASALTGILDAGVGPTVRMRALSGTGHCLPPLRPRPNLLQ